MVVLKKHQRATHHWTAPLRVGSCFIAAIALGLPAVSIDPAAAASLRPAVLAVPGRSNATPWVSAEGQFVAVTWGATLDGKTDVFVAISRNGGQSFGPPVQVNSRAGEARLGGELPPRVALVRRPESDPILVVVWTARAQSAATIKTSRSDDGGRTFGEARILQTTDAAGDRGWPSLSVDQYGEAHAVWLDHRGFAAQRSAQGGATRDPNAAHDGVAMAQMSGVYYAATGSPPHSERELAKGVCYCCKTALASGLPRTLFVAWRHVYPGNIRDIAFASSRDGGRSFSDPIRVSEDGWSIDGCPDDGPAITVHSDGVAHLVWPTVVQYPDPKGALFYASTKDGRTFMPRVRIPTLGGPTPSHPQIAVDSSGRVVVAWDESIEGRRVAAARQVRRMATGAVSFGRPLTFARQHASYPVLAATATGFVAVFTSGVPEASVIEARLIRLPQ